MKQNLGRRSGLREPLLPNRADTRNNLRQHYERYLALAREARLSGGAIEMENCYQHAEHYFRVIRGDDHGRDQL
jgi:uncharacterized protein DUF4167